ncbi:MAG: hypothetical protein HZC46_00715 [Ignavibacterium album]|uniref:hypothetical protein n=1 Tax=Ignavibacterium album TaxID=591197 RepID=UPI0026F2729B|nr:hypothetical protein [Ignavibacterium album]MBI5660650.1 hypothetical protein [Ignavibacterium album]
MRKIYIFLFLIISILLFSCNEKNEMLTNSESNFENKGFSKIVSPYFYWDTYTYYDPLYNQYFTRCTPSYSFTYSGYTFTLYYNRSINGGGFYTNTIQIYLNGNYKVSTIWTNSDYEYNPRTILSPYFNLGSTNFLLSIKVQEFYIPMQAYSEPYSVRVSISDGR